MKLITAEKDGDLIAQISGEIDHHTAASLREEIDRKILEQKPKRLILDLGKTDFMDSSGLGLILGRARKCEEKGVGLLLLNPSGACMKILSLAGMDGQIEIKFL